ncbi:cation diffusion facilitator family transporter [Macrococcoides caseolyticum]|uniref:Cation transporter n=1 Tax=Macrococcoides caseolyticum TaxID=69966 RepID=A0ACC9MPY0_9STAP|nr:cation diffusion facilitator family transporter [Macrococcus caseolyticus]PKD97535.1 cation transporter [Macrococcus caseolyticus]PKE38391.1 cation transporter [Macrococcus caseolyticus]PKE52022.1 cation transporter [Macrococcus caseolyticus]PKE55536.1 cation transporter [Macrococcus caseolyticus]PKF18203.1 cation transporter [Macrococcus caseolyticus]
MAQEHDHTHGANKKTLLISFIIITTYMVIEAIGGFLTNSLALLADAGHMLSDSISLGVGLLAFILGEKAADYSKTYGYKRFEILAALFNGVTLVLIAIYIFYEAYQRFTDPPEVASTGMLIIATIGLLINILVAWLLMRGGDTKENLNIRAAFLHVLGDLLGSVGAIVAALMIIFFNWGWADPLASVIVAVLVLISGWRVTKESIHVLMEGTPKNVEIDAVIKTIESIPGVNNMHDLHVWSITSGKNALSCHVVVDGTIFVQESQEMLKTIEQKLEDENIGHVTIQIESDNHPHKDSVMCKDDNMEHNHEH